MSTLSGDLTLPNNRSVINPSGCTEIRHSTENGARTRSNPKSKKEFIDRVLTLPPEICIAKVSNLPPINKM